MCSRCATASHCLPLSAESEGSGVQWLCKLTSAVEQNAYSGLLVGPQDVRRRETYQYKVTNFKSIQTLSYYVILQLLESSASQNKFCLITSSKIKTKLHYS